MREDPTDPLVSHSTGALGVLLGLVGRFLAWIERLADSRRWVLWTALAATALVLVFSFPPPRATVRIGEAPEWGPLYGKLAHPLTPQNQEDPGSHGAKTAFRLSVPVVAHVLGLGPRSLKLLEILAGIALFALVAVGAERASGDRRCAVLVALLTASCFPGISAFVEHRGFFDAVAFLGLALACAWRSPVAVFCGVSLAAWTDERGMIAAGLVALLHFADAPRQGGARRFLDARVLAVVAAGLVYAGGRQILAARFGLSTPLAGTGLGFLIAQMNNAPLGIWTGLEGGWLLVLAASLVLWRQGRRTLLLASLLAGGGVVVVALMVWDITRSMAFVLPALFLSLRVLRDHESREDLTKLCRVAFVIALLWPNYYVAGKGEASWNYPLPLQLLKYARG